MSDFDMENYYDREEKSSYSWAVVVVLSLILSGGFWYAYAKGFLPTYTFLIRDGQTGLYRDGSPELLAIQGTIDAENLAAQESANNSQQQVRVQYEIDGRTVSEEEFRAHKQRNNMNPDQAPKVQVNQAPNTSTADEDNGQARKCIDKNNRAVYQSETCASKGYRSEKMITAADGAVSISTHKYADASSDEQNVERQSAIDSKKDYCRDLNRAKNFALVEYQKQQSKNWSDELARLNKRWLDNCIGVSIN